MSLFLEAESSSGAAKSDSENEEESERIVLNQVITNFDLKSGTFEWIDKDDLVKALNITGKDEIIPFLVAMGGFYNFDIVKDQDTLFSQVCQNGKKVQESLDPFVFVEI